MSSYLYNYQTVVTFSMPVRQHAVMLRCQPAENGVQTVVQEHVQCLIIISFVRDTTLSPTEYFTAESCGLTARLYMSAPGL